MTVKVRIPVHVPKFATFQEVVETNGKTVGECLHNLATQLPDIERLLYDEKGHLHGYLDISVNSESFMPEELMKPVKDGDELAIVPLLGGG